MLDWRPTKIESTMVIRGSRARVPSAGRARSPMREAVLLLHSKEKRDFCKSALALALVLSSFPGGRELPARRTGASAARRRGDATALRCRAEEGPPARREKAADDSQQKARRNTEPMHLTARGEIPPRFCRDRCMPMRPRDCEEGK